MSRKRRAGRVPNRNLFLSLGLIAGLAAGATGCASNPATGKKQLNFYSEAQEIRMGKEADAQISQQMGVVNDPQLQSYVSKVGKELAAKSERPNLPWSFKVMDDPMVNAFALPGGYIYVTRGILGHLSSEAELASVLGHEIGHVTAQHSVNQLSKAQLAQGGLLVGSVLSPEIAQAANLASSGLQLLFLKYSRDDESQADDLGLRYMANGGYETREMPKVFSLLEKVSKSSQSGRVPSWLSSHPDPGDRVSRSTKRIAERNYGQGEVNGPGYVRQLDGLVFGNDPRQGYFENGAFYHPELHFQFRFPQGWTTANEASRVVAMHPDNVALIELSTTNKSSPEAAARELEQSQGITARGSQRTNVHGMAAVRSDFQVQRENASPLIGTALFVSHENRVYQILGIAVQERANAVEGTLLEALGSFAALTDSRRLNARPQTIEVVQLPRAMTLEEFAQRYPSGVPLDKLALINGVEKGSTIASGTPVKRVVGEAIAASN
jgi:predicted Zn-dependent protease